MEKTLKIEANDDYDKYKNSAFVYTIANLEQVLTKKLEEAELIELFRNIEMPVVKVLGSMKEYMQIKKN